MAKRLHQLESEKGGLESKVAQLESDLGTAENRLKIAKESCDLYERLLDDSNAAKLQRARELLREAAGK